MMSIKVKYFDDAKAAADGGYDYVKEGKKKSLVIVEAVVVKNGTAQGKPTVDFIMVDENGNEYVTMITATLLEALPL